MGTNKKASNVNPGIKRPVNSPPAPPTPPRQVIVDIDANPITLEIVELAIRLTKKHAPRVYKELEERRKKQGF